MTYQDQRDKEYQENKKIVEAVAEEVSGLREEEECILKEKAAIDAKLKKVRQDISEIEEKRGLAIAKKKMAMFAPKKKTVKATSGVPGGRS